MTIKKTYHHYWTDAIRSWLRTHQNLDRTQFRNLRKLVDLAYAKKLKEDEEWK